MQVQLSTRIEEDVAEQLAEIANTEKRSLSAQVAWIVERFIEQWKAEQQKAA